MYKHNVGLNLLFTLSFIFSSSSCTAQYLDAELSWCLGGEDELYEEKITSDEIVLALLKGPLSWEVIEPFLSETKISEVPGIHSSVMSYIVRSEEDGSYYSYHISSGNSFPICLNIQSADVLENVSSLVQGSEYFSEILSKEISQLTIETLGGASVAKFSFQDGKLYSLIFRTNYID